MTVYSDIFFNLKGNSYGMWPYLHFYCEYYGYEFYDE